MNLQINSFVFAMQLVRFAFANVCITSMFPSAFESASPHHTHETLACKSFNVHVYATDNSICDCRNMVRVAHISQNAPDRTGRRVRRKTSRREPAKNSPMLVFETQ